MPLPGGLIDDVNSCRLDARQCAFWWLGQLGFVLKFGTTVCWIDAYLAQSPKRLVPPPVLPSDITNAAVVLGTHDHSDHIDRTSWPAIAAASSHAQFVVPELARQQVIEATAIAPARITGLNDGASLTVGDVRVTAVPAAHELLDPDPATGRYPCLGYVFEGNGVCVYHSGDCCIYEGMQATLRRWKIDLAILPINGRDAVRYARHCIGNMTYQEAVDLAGALRPGLTVPGHFDMFADNGADPRLFVDYLKVKYPALATMVPEHGRRVVVPGRV
jgi:L-ascorbate 6-phosphate lactonase